MKEFNEDNTRNPIIKSLNKFFNFFRELEIWEQIIVVLMFFLILGFFVFHKANGWEIKIEKALNYLSLLALMRLHYLIGRNSIYAQKIGGQINKAEKEIKENKIDIKDLKLQLAVYIKELAMIRNMFSKVLESQLNKKSSKDE